MEIIITGLKTFGHHGVMPDEQEEGQQLLVDMVMDLGPDWRLGNDDIAETIDYAKVCEFVAKKVASTRFMLLESLADHIVEELVDRYPIKSVKVTISKPFVRMKNEVSSVGVSLERKPRGNILS